MASASVEWRYSGSSLGASGVRAETSWSGARRSSVAHYGCHHTADHRLKKMVTVGSALFRQRPLPEQAFDRQRPHSERMAVITRCTWSSVMAG